MESKMRLPGIGGLQACALATVMLLPGCVSAPEEAWKNQAGRCGYENIKEDEYAFYELPAGAEAEFDLTSKWFLEPRTSGSNVKPALVAGLRMKPLGEAEQRSNDRFQPFITKNCRKLFLNTGYSMRSLAEEPSIYKVAELERLQELQGSKIHLTEVGGNVYSLTPGTALTVEDVSVTIEEPGKKPNLKLITKSADGDSYTIVNNRRYFTVSGNSDPATLAAFRKKNDERDVWQFSTLADDASNSVVYAARSPSRSYKRGGELSIGVRCQKGRPLVTVKTDTFISQHQRPFVTEVKIDDNEKLSIPMTVSASSNMAGAGDATKELVRQLETGHYASVEVITWNKSRVSADVPLLGAQKAILQVGRSCQ